MKKIISVIILLLASIFVFSACGGTPALSYDGSYWLGDSTNLSVGNVDEKLVYEVTSEKDSYTNEFVANLKGSYTITFTNLLNPQDEGIEALDGVESCYKYTTLLEVSGNYINSTLGKQIDVNDRVEATVYFLGLDTNLSPVYTVKNVKCVSPLDNKAENYQGLDYKVETKYSGGKARVEFTYNDEDTQKYFKSTGHSKSYTREYSTNTFVENELMFLFIRGFKSKDNFSKSFTTLDVVSESVLKMNCALSSKTPSQTIELPSGAIIDGIAKDKIENTDHISFVINSTYMGRDISANFAPSGDVATKNRRFLVKLVTALPYNSGNLVCTLKTATFKK